jgi:molybdopterin molybdotransferase
MPANEEQSCGGQFRDVRQRGFYDRASVEQATAWIDARGGTLAAEVVTVADAVGRVLASPVQAKADLPLFDCVTADGYALRSGETIGTGDYNPLLLAIQDADSPLLPTSAALVAAGMPLPGGADAVLPFEALRAGGSSLEVCRAVAQGVGVERKGQQLSAGTTILDNARIVHQRHLGLLLASGIEHLKVVRRPRVRLVIAGPKLGVKHHGPDVDGPMLSALIARDGGLVESVVNRAERREVICRAVNAPGADIILVVGRTGTGADDQAPLAIAEIGELAIHGVALRPAGSTGLGLVAGVPVVLIPGEPLACFCCYELFAGRLVRRMGARAPEFPHAVREAEVRRKIVSVVGLVDLCQVRFVDGGVEPIGSAESGGLAAAVRADGFVVIPAPLEGIAPGARINVHVY